MTDIESLEELHRLLTENRGKLDDNLSNARDVVYSEIGWQYSVMGEYDDGSEQQVQWLFKNEPGKIYARPSVGSRLTYSDGSPVFLFGAPLKVLYFQRSDQEEVVYAKQALEEAIAAGGSLGMMNEQDLTNLIEVPKTLARSRNILQDVKGTFEVRKAEGGNLYGTGGTWTGSGYQNYVNALSVYLGRFDTMITDIDNLSQAHIPLVDKVVDLCNAILQVYIDTVEGAVEFITGLISLTKGPVSWQSGASALANLLGDASTQHHRAVQDKLQELKGSFQFGALVELASNIDLGPWPLPEGISNCWR